jgi:Magnesium chelatase, subunit ChlI
MRERPLRAPHHSASTVALIGGGNGGRIRPGELTLAQASVRRMFACIAEQIEYLFVVKVSFAMSGS